MASKRDKKTLETGILLEAHDLINGERQKQYGQPSQFFTRLSEHWSLYLTQRLGVLVQVEAEDVLWMMVDMKKLRQMHSKKPDNVRDAAGYIGLIEHL